MSLSRFSLPGFKGRLAVIVAVGVVVLGLAVGYLLYARAQTDAVVNQAQPGATTDPESILAAPHIVFRNSVLGANLGRLAAVSSANPGGPRAIFIASCERVYATKGSGVCVFAKRGVVQTYGVMTLNAQLTEASRSELVGLPSRARMSADGRLVATTTFITGHSYAAASFSTETIIRRDGKSLGNIETWTTIVDDQQLTAVNRNFWGVTFASDDDTFYATAASGDKTWLVKGSLQNKRMTALHDDAECPSLSPDGTKIAYKKRLGNATPGVWRLAVLDLASGKETLLAETRSVDDQVEWLDQNSILYAMSRPGADATTSDVWSVPADGTGQPAVLIPQASSPAVVRG